MRNSLVLLGVASLWHVAQWVSRAPPQHTLTAFLNHNGIIPYKIFIKESSLKIKISQKNLFLLANKSINTLKRSDRDKFVKIVLKNAGQYCGTTGKETCAGNFAKAPQGLVDYPEEYDKVNTI